MNVVVLIDRDDKNKLYSLNINVREPKKYFANYCKVYVEKYPVGQPIKGLVFEQYTFPDLDSVPDIPSEEAEKRNYYSHSLKPVADKLDLKSKYALSMDELLYAVMHDKSVSVVGNNSDLTSLPDFATECAKYRQAAPYISSKTLRMDFGDSAITVRLESYLKKRINKLTAILKGSGRLSVQSMPFRSHSRGTKIK